MAMFDGSAVQNFLNTTGLAKHLGMGQPTKRESIQQTQQRMTGAGKMTEQELEALNTQARQAGYPSYEAMILRQRQMQAPGGSVQSRRGVQGAWDNAMAWHPKNLLEYAMRQIQGATGGEE